MCVVRRISKFTKEVKAESLQNSLCFCCCFLLVYFQNFKPYVLSVLGQWTLYVPWDNDTQYSKSLMIKFLDLVSSALGPIAKSLFKSHAKFSLKLQAQW